MQTSQSRSRCGHGQYEGEVSKQEFQGLNLTSNKTDKFALALAEAVGAVLDSVHKSCMVWKVFPM